ATPAAAEPTPGSGMSANLDLIMDIPIDIQIVLGTSRMQVSSLMNLTEGATIALDRKIGEPVEIMVNGRVIGRGEITVLEGDVTRFGVKLLEIKGSRK
ncbi:flagellar motor switch protein FliN, partial [Sinorhizobium medicae]